MFYVTGMYYDYPEITPHNKKGDFRYNKGNEKVLKFASQEVEARALIEGQFMAKRLHVEKMGFKTGKKVNSPSFVIFKVQSFRICYLNACDMACKALQNS